MGFPRTVVAVDCLRSGSLEARTAQERKYRDHDHDHDHDQSQCKDKYRQTREL